MQLSKMTVQKAKNNYEKMVWHGIVGFNVPLDTL